MYLDFKYLKYHFRLNVDNHLNAVLGDSSTGKTALVNYYSRSKQQDIHTDAAYVFTELNQFIVDNLPPESLLLLDLDNYAENTLIDALISKNRNDIYVVLFGRKWLSRFPIDVDNTYRLVNVKGVTINTRFIEKELYNPLPFTSVLVEDSGSGFYFLKEVFKDVKPAGSNSVFAKRLPKSVLSVFDTVGFGAYIEEFLFNNENNPYLGWPSFEGFILDRVYSISDKPKAFNVERALTYALQQKNHRYSKSSKCYSNDCYSCTERCKSNAKDLFKHSRYSELLNQELSYAEVYAARRLAEQGKDTKLVNTVLELLPKHSMDTEELEKSIDFAIGLV